MFYKIISILYPRRIKKKIVDLLVYSSIKTEPNRFLGFMLLFNFLLGIMTGVYLGLFFKLKFFIVFPLTFVLFCIIELAYINLNADKKAVFIEGVLPDALQLMASNLRAGITVDRALLLSVRSEFGPLNDEINLVGKKVTAGTDIVKALREMTERIKSKKLEKAIMLITSGLRSGGELASLIEQTSEDLSNQNLVDKKIRASVGMYVMFIFVAICIGAPVLFGLSSYLVEILTGTIGKINIPDTSAINNLRMPFSVPKITITKEFLTYYIIGFLLMTSIFGSLVIGLIRSGHEKDGFKYVIPILVISIALFFIVKLIASHMLGGLFNIA